MGGSQGITGTIRTHLTIAQNEVRQDREHRFTGRALDPPEGETTQPDTGIVGMAGQAPALAAAGLVEELKAESEEKRAHELDKRLGVTQELKVRRLVLKIDGDGPVVACRLGCLSHLSPPLRWSLALMRHHGGNMLKYQEYCEERRVLPLNSMECAIFFLQVGNHLLLVPLDPASDHRDEDMENHSPSSGWRP